MIVPLLILLSALLGGLASYLANLSEKRLHLALALSTGTFLGAVFLHLLPEIAASAGMEGGFHEIELASELDHGHEHEAVEARAAATHNHGSPAVWLGILVGVLLIHSLGIVLGESSEQVSLCRLRNASIAAMVGLSVHAASAGLGLAALHHSKSLSSVFVVAFLAHKALECFGVVSILQLARVPRTKVVVLLVAFSLLTPLCMVIGEHLISDMTLETLPVITAVATGTFLYVCLTDLLPEVFTHQRDSFLKFTLLLVGVGMSYLVLEVGG